MPTSETGRSTSNRPTGRDRAAGFTLLELVVVIAIVGVLVTFATLAVPDRSRAQLDRAGERLTAEIEACVRGAVLSAVPHGVFARTDSYTPVRWRGSWQSVEPARALSDALALEAHVAIDGDDPAVVCLPTGEIHMASLRLRRRGSAAYYEFVTTADGDIDAVWREPAS